jgi:hypothetical protein
MLLSTKNKKPCNSIDYKVLSGPYGTVYEPFYAGFKEASFIKWLLKSSELTK